MKLNKLYVCLFYIFFIGAFLRLFNLNWDEGYYLHPDERLYVNASTVSLPTNINDFLSPLSPLNPNMFYYGSFPLYLYKLVHFLSGEQFNFLLTSRFVSAIFSIGTIPVIFLIGQSLFSKRVGLFAAFIFAFAPGSIQYAHFNTTESILIFLLSATLYLAIKMYQLKKLQLILSLGTIVALAYATKIVGLTFGLLPFISYISLFRKRRIYIVIATGIIGFIVFLIVGFLAAPYQIIDSTHFFSEQSYMQNVVVGKERPPFVIIYEQTLPYIYPFLHVLPFTFGFISFPLAIVGFLAMGKKYIQEKKYFLLIILFLYPLLYYAWSGAWYAKFSRYYILLFPFLCIWGAYIIEKTTSYWRYIFLSLIAVNGLSLFSLYYIPHTRIAASQWIYKHIPSNSIIAGEHWDDPLPLPMTEKDIRKYTLLQLAVYEPDTDIKITTLTTELAHADYIILSSRRVYHSIVENKDHYPLTSNFYKKLFSKEIGYELVKKFTNYPFYISDDFADESFQSYDHPPVYVFQNTAKFSQQVLEDKIRQKN